MFVSPQEVFSRAQREAQEALWAALSESTEDG